MIAGRIGAQTPVKGGTRAAGAGQTNLSAYTVNANETFTMVPGGTGLGGDGTFNAKDVTKAEVDATYRGAEKLVGFAVYVSGKAAEKIWRSGKCIEVVVAPNGGDVAANSITSVTAKVRHKFDGDELQRPISLADEAG